MESLSLVPRDGTTGEKVLETLTKNFKIDDIILQGLIQAKIENLEEFRFFFEDESRIEPWTAKLKLGEDKSIQVARLRRAWAAVRMYYQHLEQDRARVVASDLDTLLDDSTLRDAKTTFWKRYHCRYPPEVHPADATLSRVAREMSKRMLCVFQVWKVRSLQFQLHTTNKKRKLGDNLFTEDHEDDDASPRDWETYLDKLLTLLLAYAMAGTAAIPVVPGGPALSDILGSDSCLAVEVPLDVVMAYYFRAKRTSSQLPMAKRLSWLRQKDMEERSEWVAKFRESQMTLGTVIKEVMAQRDAHWVTMGWAPSDPIASPPSVENALSPAKSGKPSHFTLGKPINGRSVARIMKDGTKLCQAFQQGNCKNKPPCAQGQHRCALVTRKERVCGAAGHGAHACRNNSKVG